MMGVVGGVVVGGRVVQRLRRDWFVSATSLVCLPLTCVSLDTKMDMEWL